MKKSLFVFMLLCFTSTMNAQKNEIANGLYWELNSGVLTISGYGDIPGYTSPWDGKGNVEKIIIQDGVTSIGKVTFWEYGKPHHLKTLVIGNSVTSIGERAFTDCILLQDVTLGNSVTYIADAAFSGCSSLQSIVIPSSVTLHEDAFYNCKNLTITKKVDGPNNSEYSIIIDNKSGKCGLKNSIGNWTIPLGTHKYLEPLGNNYLRVKDVINGYYKFGLYTFDGNEIVAPEVDAIEQAGKGFLRFKINGFWGVMNYQGKIIIPTDRGYTKIGDYVSLTKRFPYEMDGYKGECNNLGVQVSKIKVATPKPTNTTTSTSSNSSNSSTSSSNTSSNSNNSNNKTTTVVGEHHRDPVPVQQWQACFACGGMGTMGCDNCGGGGTKYIGDRLHRCSRCNGQGLIPCKSCYGNKGQYITVYQ